MFDWGVYFFYTEILKVIYIKRKNSFISNKYDCIVINIKYLTWIGDVFIEICPVWW